MGSLDVSSAKQQFFELVDAISASHLPSFTIWLDAKLAEYKTIGQLKPDSDYESKEQYPEWIGKALRQNLSFLFPGPSQTVSSSGKDSTLDTPDVRKRRSSQSSDIASEKKRTKLAFVDHNLFSEPADDLVMIVKEEPGGKQQSDYSRVTETPLPGIQSTFSLSTEPINDFAGERGRKLGPQQPAAFAFATPSRSLTSPPATMTPPNQPLSASLTRPTFSSSKPNEATSSSKRLNFDSPSSHPESMPLFSPSAVAKKVEASPQLSSPAGEASVAYPVSSGAAQSSDAEGSEGPALQVTDEAVQEAIRIHHGGKATYAVPRSLIQKRKTQGPFVCPIPVCSEASENVADYRKHFLVHTQEKPFACPYCPLRLNHYIGIHRHQKESHSDKPIVKVLPTV